MTYLKIQHVESGDICGDSFIMLELELKIAIDYSKTIVKNETGDVGNAWRVWRGV